MINALHLIWIIPLSAIAGVICYACIVVGKEADEEEKRLKETIEGC